MNFFGEHAEITIETQGTSFKPGDTVQLTASLKVMKHFHVRWGHVQLLYINRYRPRNLRGEKTWVDGHDKVVVDSRVLVESSDLTPGETVTKHFGFHLPDDAPASGGGDITGIRWKARAELDVPLHRDVRHDMDLELVMPASRAVIQEPRAQGWIEELRRPNIYFGPGGIVDGSGQESEIAELAFVGVNQIVRSGDRVSGTLRVTPLKTFDARDVRVAIIRRELVVPYPGSSGNTSEHMGNEAVIATTMHFESGQPQEFPFSAIVPRDASPAYGTPRTVMIWMLHGEIFRRLHRPATVELPLHIYNAG